MRWVMPLIDHMQFPAAVRSVEAVKLISAALTQSQVFTLPLAQDGTPWVCASGVGSGWIHLAPICGVCTTTTTPAPDDDQIEDAGVEEAGVEDAAAAVGDPHMIKS